MLGKVLSKAELDELMLKESGLSTREELSALEQSFLVWADDTPSATDHFDHDFYPVFLRGCKYQLEKAQDKLCKFWKWCAQLDSYFGGSFNPEIGPFSEALDQGLYLPLQAYDQAGRRIILERSCSIDTSDIDPYVRVAHMTLLRLLQSDVQAQVMGISTISDMSGAYLSHLYGFWGHVRDSIHLLKEAYPVRVKLINILSPPIVMRPIIAFFSKFASGKLLARIDYYNKQDLSRLIEEMGEICIPKEYGGLEIDVSESAKAWVNFMKTAESK